MEPTSETLGDFLRARREHLSPEAVGLPAGARRRVQGLRREEVAMLAGISAEYYIRLEQGRDLHPSDQILDSIATALQLDDDAATYLHRLAHPAPAARRRRTRQAAGVNTQMQALLDAWTTTPAYVQAPSSRIVAANRLAVALSPHFAVGRNPLLAMFLEPEMRLLYPDWEAVAAKAVAAIRAMVAVDHAEAEVVEVIGELSIGSERFRTLWARRDVRSRAVGPTRFDHPVVGALELNYHKAVLPDTGQIMVVYHADPGSKTAESLRLLSSL